MIGAQVVVVGLFGGVLALVIGVLVVTAAVSGLAIALDRTAGPGLGDTDGSVNRGTLLGVAGCALVFAIGWTALQQDIGNDVPVPLRYAVRRAGLRLDRGSPVAGRAAAGHGRRADRGGRGRRRAPVAGGHRGGTPGEDRARDRDHRPPVGDRDRGARRARAAGHRAANTCGPATWPTTTRRSSSRCCACPTRRRWAATRAAACSTPPEGTVEPTTCAEPGRRHVAAGGRGIVAAARAPRRRDLARRDGPA